MTTIYADICVEVGLRADEMLRVPDDTRKMLGFLSRAAKFLREKLMERDPNNSALASKISSFEFAAHVSELYIMRALNMDEIICWDNVNELKAQVQRNLNYFARLRAAQLQRREQGYEL